ncbi:MAG: PAS domain S-box protein, partial [Spongiibacteraceae bacterium]
MDISQRKQTESALHESSSKIEAIVQTVLDGIITIDQYGTINSLNPAAEQIFQYNAYELIGCNVKMLMPNPYQEEHDQYLKNYLTTGTQKVIGIGREVTGLRKDGSTFPMNLAVNRMEVAGETAFVGTVKDISERIEKEEQIKIEIGKTEKANQELQA